MPHPELSHSSEPRNTPQALIDLYERLAAPLAADAIRTIVEPFAGSSFADIIIDSLREKLHNNPGEKRPLKGSTIYLSLFHKADDTNQKPELQGYEKDVAEIAMQSHLSHAVGIELIYPDHRLAPGEMAFWQCRYDTVWHDPDHTRKAFTHTTEAWRLYKNGYHLGDIPIQSVQFQDAHRKLHFPTVITEASPDLVFFHDPRRQGVQSIPAYLQEYAKQKRMLFVSEQFDFDLCLRK